jgi:cell division protein FtsB
MPGTAYSAQRSTRYPVKRIVRWDRVGRLALLAVLIVLVYLYVSAGVSLLGSWHASEQDSAKVAALKHENAALKRERSAEKQGWEIETSARRLGMAQPNEKPFIMRSLPGD